MHKNLGCFVSWNKLTPCSVEGSFLQVSLATTRVQQKMYYFSLFDFLPTVLPLALATSCGSKSETTNPTCLIFPGLIMLYLEQTLTKFPSLCFVQSD